MRAKLAVEPITSAAHVTGNHFGQPLDCGEPIPLAPELRQRHREDVELAQPPETARHPSELSANSTLRLRIDLQKRDELAETSRSDAGPVDDVGIPRPDCVERSCERRQLALEERSHLHTVSRT